MIVIQRLRRFSSTRWYFYSLQKLSEWKIFVFFFLRVFRCRGGKMRIFFAFFLPIFTRLPGYCDTMKVKSVLFLLVPARFFSRSLLEESEKYKKKITGKNRRRVCMRICCGMKICSIFSRVFARK